MLLLPRTNLKVKKTCQIAVQAEVIVPQHPHVPHPAPTENVGNTIDLPTEHEEADVESTTTETMARAAPLNVNVIIC